MKSKYNILFVARGNRHGEVSPIIRNQGESLLSYGIEIYYYPITGGLEGYIKHVFFLRKFLKKNNFDIIHAHYVLCGLVAWLSKNKNQKMVISFMGDDLLGEHNEKGDYTLRGNLLVHFSKFLCHKTDYTLVKSKEMFEKISKYNNVSVLPNGVNLSKFYLIPKQLSRNVIKLSTNEIVVIFSSDPKRPEKNFRLAQKALSILNKKEVKVVFLKNISNETLTFYYNAADLLILTSFHEGSPNVIKEAMACNCPIVSTDVGDVAWVFGDTEGCYIASFDPKDFAEKMKLAITFSEKFSRTKGRERIVELGLDSDVVAKRIKEIYCGILNDC